MATHQLAKGLASLGRHGDSMLMHVSPAEVAGLNALGKMTGHKLHTNPDTGMPEAFDFGDFFTSLLPMAAGILLAPGTGGASLVASSLGQTAAAAAPVVAGMATGAVVAGAKGEDPLMGGLMGGLGGYGGGNIGGSLGKMGAQGGFEASKNLVGPQLTLEGGLSAAGSGQGMATTLANQAASAAPTTFAEGMGNMGRGLGKLVSPGGYDTFTSPAIGGSGTQLATSIGIPALQAMQPKPIDTTDEEAKRKAEASKYVDPITGKLNPYQSRPNFGTMLMATGGAVNTNSSSISSGGIQDLYGTNDQTTGTQNLSKDGYGIGRLDNLASEGSRAKAADTFYAEGGPIAFAKGGSSYIHIPGYNDPVVSQGSLGSNPLLALLAQMFAKQGLFNAQTNASAETPAAPTTAPAPTTIDPLNAPGMYPQAADNYMASVPTDKGTFALKAKGGYLDGAGDGMSDSIPGTIEGKQPARLADGEFVVPADVVSHLGNGSSKAGAKNLYAMMNKVRKARTGNPKQGKQINPNKYMPA
jgi:hypothetical protein